MKRANGVRPVPRASFGDEPALDAEFGDGRPPRVLVIAGSDPSGGAGLQSDLKVVHALGAYGTSVVTAITVQDTVRVHEVSA
ncbi:MAG TPA: bifunctional hydroxymethylpyrimidine kinase/phosphomethylpyrimidine kinase, partial [Polyangiaceae bacterium]|nr:bifunctional hydroxymethylpyrimidine kinase/phosphomethylpyrimidine kinase [Polyangiaceae bacterium]